MIRLATNELIMPDGTIVPFGAGNFLSLKEMERSIIKALFEKFLCSGKPVSSCYSEAAQICGVSARTVENLIAGRI